MPFNCDPCTCTENHIRHEPTWRKAVLTVLCQIVTAIGDLIAATINVCVTCALPAGDNNIGNVDIVTMPAVTLASDTTINSDRQVCASAGTPDVFGSHACKRVDIMALPTNTDIVCIGGVNVDATLATRMGIALSAGQTYSISVANTNILYVDSVVNGEGVCYNYFA